MVLLTQFGRKLHLSFRLLATPSISVLVIIISIFILVPTLTIIFSFFLIPSGLLVSFRFWRLHGKYTCRLGSLIRSRSLSRCRLVSWQLAHLFHNQVRRFGTCTSHNTISMWPRLDLRVEIGPRSIGYNLIQKSGLSIDLLETFTTIHTLFGQFVLVKPLS